MDGDNTTPAGIAATLDPFLVSAIKGFEGFAPKAQWDQKQYSVGYGTRAQSPNEVIDRDEAERRLASGVAKAAQSVDALGVPIPAGARNALISLTYNAGPGWMKSGLGDLVRAGDWEGARSRFLEYNKAGGEVSPGLAARRQQEAAWFGDPAAAPGGASTASAASAPAAPGPAALLGMEAGAQQAPAAAPTETAGTGALAQLGQALMGGGAQQQGEAPALPPIQFAVPVGVQQRVLSALQQRMGQGRG